MLEVLNLDADYALGRRVDADTENRPYGLQLGMCSRGLILDDNRSPARVSPRCLIGFVETWKSMPSPFSVPWTTCRPK